MHNKKSTCSIRVLGCVCVHPLVFGIWSFLRALCRRWHFSCTYVFLDTVVRPIPRIWLFVLSTDLVCPRYNNRTLLWRCCVYPIELFAVFSCLFSRAEYRRVCIREWYYWCTCVVWHCISYFYVLVYRNSRRRVNAVFFSVVRMCMCIVLYLLSFVWKYA